MNLNLLLIDWLIVWLVLIGARRGVGAGCSGRRNSGSSGKNSAGATRRKLNDGKLNDSDSWRYNSHFLSVSADLIMLGTKQSLPYI